MNFVFAGNPASFAANNPPVIAGFEQNLLNGTSRNTQLYSPLKIWSGIWVSVSFLKLPRLMGRLVLGPHVVGRLVSGMRVSAIFHLR